MSLVNAAYKAAEEEISQRTPISSPSSNVLSPLVEAGLCREKHLCMVLSSLETAYEQLVMQSKINNKTSYDSVTDAEKKLHNMLAGKPPYTGLHNTEGDV